ncbi:MAG: tripartite tricarboxylate transporter substrate binding protein [Pusillimonas sp.]
MKKVRHMLAMACATIVGTALLGPAAAQTFPDKPVKLLVGTAPGGGTDFVARLVAQELSKEWGQTVVVENRTGASGTIAGSELVNAKPDGYTLWISPQTSIAVAPQLLAKSPYDPLKDLTPITVIASSPLVLVAHPSFPASNFKEYIEYVKKDPGSVSFASGGVGSSPHMTQELLNKELSLKMIHVPYRGEAPAIADVLGGQVPVLFANIPSGMPHVNSGKLKALVTTGATRSPQAPEVPTMIESGVVNVQTATWNALYAPAGMPPELVQKIYADVAQAFKQGEARERLLASGNEPVLNTPAEFEVFLRDEYKRWGDVIKAGNLQAE